MTTYNYKIIYILHLVLQVTGALLINQLDDFHLVVALME